MGDLIQVIDQRPVHALRAGQACLDLDECFGVAVTVVADVGGESEFVVGASVQFAQQLAILRFGNDGMVFPS